MLTPLIIAFWFGYRAYKLGKNVVGFAIIGILVAVVLTFVIHSMLFQNVTSNYRYTTPDTILGLRITVGILTLILGFITGKMLLPFDKKKPVECLKCGFAQYAKGRYCDSCGEDIYNQYKKYLQLAKEAEDKGELTNALYNYSVCLFQLKNRCHDQKEAKNSNQLKTSIERQITALQQKINSNKVTDE